MQVHQGEISLEYLNGVRTCEEGETKAAGLKPGHLQIELRFVFKDAADVQMPGTKIPVKKVPSAGICKSVHVHVCECMCFPLPWFLSLCFAISFLFCWCWYVQVYYRAENEGEAKRWVRALGRLAQQDIESDSSSSDSD